MDTIRMFLLHMAITFLVLASSGCVHINNAEYGEFILVVARNRDVEALDSLIERVGHIDARDRYGNTFLSISALQGYTEFVDHLLQGGADPTRGKSGRSALHSAAQGGHMDIIELLLKAGVDVDIRCRQTGITPLMSAARNARSDTVALLLERGADSLVKDRYRNNVFAGMGGTFPSRMDTSTFDRNVERTITLLAEAGADVNHVSGNLRTPLMQMCYIGSEVGVATLLKYGADPTAVNRNGQSVLEFADGNEALVRLINEAISAKEALKSTTANENH